MAHQHDLHILSDGARLHVAITTAGFHARRLARSLVVPGTDHEDFRQIILLAMLTRSGRYDARRGSWATFAALIARNATADLVRANRSRPDVQPLEACEQDLADPAPYDPVPGLDLGAALDNLPLPCRRLVDLIARTGSLAGAQRASTMSPASFYRHVHDLRLRLLMAGLGTAA